MRYIILLLLGVILISGCTTQPEKQEFVPSHALPEFVFLLAIPIDGQDPNVNNDLPIEDKVVIGWCFDNDCNQSLGIGIEEFATPEEAQVRMQKELETDLQWRTTEPFVKTVKGQEVIVFDIDQTKIEELEGESPTAWKKSLYIWYHENFAFFIAETHEIPTSHIEDLAELIISVYS